MCVPLATRFFYKPGHCGPGVGVGLGNKDEAAGPTGIPLSPVTEGRKPQYSRQKVPLWHENYFELKAIKKQWMQKRLPIFCLRAGNKAPFTRDRIFFFRATTVAYEVTRLGVVLEPHLRLKPQPQQWQILNPLSGARDQIYIFMDTSQILNPLSHNGNSWRQTLISPKIRPKDLQTNPATLTLSS